jgi:DnaJ-class molecular chaperone
MEQACDNVTCPVCEGEGHVTSKNCRCCDGTGKITKKKADILARIRHDLTWRLLKEGW